MTHWHVLGAGAIGSLFAAALQASGVETTLIRRQGDSATQRRFTLRRDDGTQTITLPTSAADSDSPIDLLLITTKAFDVVSAVASIAHRLHANSQALLLVNGMGLLPELAQYYPQVTWYAGTTTEGTYRTADGEVVHAGRGHTRVGAAGADGRPPLWFIPWQSAIAPSTWEADIEACLWHKLAINCAINPLTAIHQCRNGELGLQPALRAQVDTLCAEIVAVSRAAGFAHTATTLADDALAVIKATANNHSSMLQDVRSGGRTEIDYITGYLCAVAATHGIATPLNNTLLAEVKHRAV